MLFWYLVHNRNSCGFKRIDEEDNILWSWNGKNGEITTKQSYAALFNKLFTIQDDWWYGSFWK